MVRAAALIWIMGAAAYGQTDPERLKLIEHRSNIQTLAHNPALRDTKVTVAVTSGGSRWMIRAGDLADTWTSYTFYPHAWVFVDHAPDKTTKMRETRMRVGVRCKEQQFAILAMVDYAANGSVIHNFQNYDTPSSYSDIIPETMAEAVEKEICPLG